VTKHEEPSPPQASRSMMAATVPFTLGNASAGLIEICWNPDHDSAVLVPFEELYALTHTIQSNDAFRR